jgi:hypothetical protein
MQNIPYGGKVIKNLLYHIWPVKDRGQWQWNVSQLLRRIEQFNGQRVVSVVTDEGTDTFETVKAAFKGTVTDFMHFRNNPVLGEMVSFPELLKRVEHTDPRHITYYAHAKGVKYQVGEQPMVRQWVHTMHSNMLDYPSLVEDALRTKMFVGTFKKSGNTFDGLPPAWHFAGTFWWFRNHTLFGGSNYHHAPKQWWGTEAWPGVVSPPDEAECLMMEGKAPTMMLYKRKYWQDEVNETWKQWQIKYAELRAPSTYSEVLKTIQSLRRKEYLRTRQIVVTGPQRSGTVIASKMLAKDLGLTHIGEWAFGTHNHEDFFGLIEASKPFVIQAPTMSAYAHLLPCTVVWMNRNLADIQRSEKRINWNVHEQLERDSYFEHSQRPSAVIKTEAWQKFQRIALGERAFDLDYESLKGHPMWVDPENRVCFTERQTSPSC